MWEWRLLAFSATLSGVVRLPSPTMLPPRARLHVRLLEAPMADARSRVLAETSRPAHGLSTGTLKFALKYDLPQPPPAVCLLEAELRLAGGPTLQSGDYLSTYSVRWSAAQAKAPVTIRLERVD
jgi:hypothetical protein